MLSLPRQSFSGCSKSTFMNVQDRIVNIKGDITTIEVDAIVNAANTSLMGGGGVDGAIHRRGGKAILEDCRKIIARQGKCNPGNAVITTAGNLPAKFVIHTVGPVWNGGMNNEHETLANCYFNSLALLRENDCKTIAFPNISTGIYGFPKPQAAKIAVETVTQFLQQDSTITTVFFVCFDEDNFRLIETHL